MLTPKTQVQLRTFVACHSPLSNLQFLQKSIYLLFIGPCTYLDAAISPHLVNVTSHLHPPGKDINCDTDRLDV